MSSVPTNPTPPLAQSARAKKVHIKNWGCQMNVYDGDRMLDALAPLGYAPTAETDEADLIILNTCHIREKATEKLFSELGRLRHLSESRGTLLAVAGCVAQAEGAEITRRAPYVKMVFGPQTYHRLPQMIAEVHRAAGRVLDVDFPAESKFDVLPASQRAASASAFLTIQEGCDKFCTFCVVPYTRGAEFSRPVAAVLEEAKQLVAKGAVELMLLGQNVNAYHGEGPDGRSWSLAQLLHALAALPGLARLRYTTSHPLEMSEDLLLAHRDLPQLMPLLHLPVQSGSDVILAAMNRRHTAADYLRIIARMRELNPQLAFSSDFIVGFPGESDADFAATLALVREVNFASAFAFAYSPRPGTPAALMSDQVPPAVQEARLQELLTLLRAQSLAFNQSKLGTSMEVLLTDYDAAQGSWLARSPWLQPVHVAAPADNGQARVGQAGQLVQVTITHAGRSSLNANWPHVGPNAQQAA